MFGLFEKKDAAIAREATACNVVDGKPLNAETAALILFGTPNAIEFLVIDYGVGEDRRIHQIEEKRAGAVTSSFSHALIAKETSMYPSQIQAMQAAVADKKAESDGSYKILTVSRVEAELVVSPLFPFFVSHDGADRAKFRSALLDLCAAHEETFAAKAGMRK